MDDHSAVSSRVAISASIALRPAAAITVASSPEAIPAVLRAYERIGDHRGCLRFLIVSGKIRLIESLRSQAGNLLSGHDGRQDRVRVCRRRYAVAW